MATPSGGKRNLPRSCHNLTHGFSENRSLSNETTQTFEHNGALALHVDRPVHNSLHGEPALTYRRLTRHESQFPLSSQTEQRHRTGRPVVDAYSSSYSEWNVDKTWSSQEWKSDELMEDRTGRPVVFAQHTDRFIVENDKMNSYTEAESPDHSCTG